MRWLAEFVAADATDEALAALLDDGFGMDLLVTEGAPRSPCAASPSGSGRSFSPSTTDCADSASDNGVEWTSSRGSEPASPPTEHDAGKEATRIAANRARLYRYYRSQGELVGLRRKAAELQETLDRLKQEDARACAASLATAPCPFADVADDEIDTDDNAPLKTPLLSSSVRVSDWKHAAMEEHRRLRRAQAVRRKLKRLLRDYESVRKRFVERLQLEQVEMLLPFLTTTYLFSLVDCCGEQRAAGLASSECALPVGDSLPFVLPGAELAEALMSSGVVLLREVYHIACDACGISPSASVPLSNSGGKLAYSLLLGAGIETSWTREYNFPRSDPHSIATLWLRGVREQGPRKCIVRNSIKTHNLEHTCSERKFTWKLETPQCTVSVDMDGATVMQTVEERDHVVLVWTVSFHDNGSSAAPRPLFRGSGWMVFRVSSNGLVSCRTCARVHHIPLGSRPPPADNRADRDAVVGVWRSALQTKQRNMWKRLLLMTQSKRNPDGDGGEQIRFVMCDAMPSELRLADDGAVLADVLAFLDSFDTSNCGSEGQSRSDTATSSGSDSPRSETIATPKAAGEAGRAAAARARADARNRARVKRYHRKKSELVTLRRQAASLARQVELLTRRIGPVMQAQQTSALGVIVTKADAATGTSPRSSWQRRAQSEFEKRRRAEQINAQLREFFCAHVKHMLAVQGELVNCDLETSLAQILGHDGADGNDKTKPQRAMDADANEDVWAVVLRQLYREACALADLNSLETIEQMDWAGAALANAPTATPIEWTNSFSIPNSSPRNIGKMWWHAVQQHSFAPGSGVDVLSYRDGKVPRLEKRTKWLVSDDSDRESSVYSVTVFESHENGGNWLVVAYSSFYDSTGSELLFRSTCAKIVIKPQSKQSRSCIVRTHYRVSIPMSGSGYVPFAPEASSPRELAINMWTRRMHAKDDSMKRSFVDGCA